MHFSFDLWTSPNHRAFLGIIGHWIDPLTNTLKATLLGLRRFYGPHTGSNQASYFWDIATDYDLTRRIGHFVLDNASNNDTAVQQICDRLAELGIHVDPRQRRLRCLGHILNLAVKAFLMGSDRSSIEGFTQDDDNSYDYENSDINENSDEEAIRLIVQWRKKGPIGKLRNCLLYIGRSPQRRDRFHERCSLLYPGVKATSPIVGNHTRWHGDVDSIERAFQLRDAIEEFIANAIRLNQDNERGTQPGCLQNDELTPGDWTTLREIFDILQPFRAWMKRLQGVTGQNHGCLAQQMEAIHELLSHLEESRSQATQGAKYNPNEDGRDDGFILSSINNAWGVLNRYAYLTILS